MIEKYKPGLTLFSVLSILIILFPPIAKEINNRIIESSFSFIFSIPKYYSINFPILIIEIVFAFFISLLFQLNSEKIKQWFKTNF